MKYFKGIQLTGLFVAVILLAPASLMAGAPKESDCQKEESLDKRHLCLALINDRNEGDPQEKDRYRNKDHSAYYCSLIGTRDMQNYCYAILEGDSKKCELLSSAELEKECKSKI